jgi:hypothetical protein
MSDEANTIVGKSKILQVRNVGDLLKFLQNGTYTAIVNPVTTKNGVQLFIPLIRDNIHKLTLGILKVYPKGSNVGTEEDLNGKVVLSYLPEEETQVAEQQLWTQVQEIFADELIRMKSAEIRDRPITKYLNSSKDKIRPFDSKQLEKFTAEYDGDVHVPTAKMNSVYFMEDEKGKTLSCGVTYQLGYLQRAEPVVRTRVGAKRARVEEPVELSSAPASVESEKSKCDVV